MPPTCPGALTLPSTASSSAEGSPSPPSPPSHCGLPPKSLGASVRKNRWRGKMTASAKRKQKAGNNVGDPGLIPESGRSPGEEMATHSSTLAWKIPWTEKHGRLQSMGSQRVGHD